MSLAHSRLQCLVETHSEYLINRLRYRTATSDTQLERKLRIYFTESSGSTSTYRQVELNQYGSVLDWPKGFFDEAQVQAESILRAGLRKRKGRAKNASSAPRD